MKGVVSFADKLELCKVTTLVKVPACTLTGSDLVTTGCYPLKTENFKICIGF